MIAPKEVLHDAQNLHEVFMRNKEVVHKMSDSEVKAILQIEVKGGHLRHKAPLIIEGDE